MEAPVPSSYTGEVADLDRQERARKRRGRMVVKRVSLDERDDATTIRGAAAVALAARLSREQFQLAGHPLPSYERARIPVAFVPFGEE